MKLRHREPDPCEAIVEKALRDAGFAFMDETKPEAKGLDFFVPDLAIHIEVKQFHSERSIRQMAYSDNAILVQGMVAARQFGDMIRGLAVERLPPTRPSPFPFGARLTDIHLRADDLVRRTLAPLIESEARRIDDTPQTLAAMTGRAAVGLIEAAYSLLLQRAPFQYPKFESDIADMLRQARLDMEEARGKGAER